ncbi:YciI family protein [Candidatus Phycosocius spiralis]|uniref:YCII-related domain-containing protein n=1 Tax=Candidatus Phycosocius spiralis TaxID=2815099 RepID=A0ABQ4PW19_9PROT|nr:YciI family protein [Candidatus Phycosocius spiralis]GIU67189.1 hypothetical protein PsB1_1343 [Candidatus Phycosocius spiralis]
MALFIVTCLDKPSSLELRLATRPDHLAYIRRCGQGVKLAGPILSDPERRPIGSHFIVDVADLEEAKAFAQQDPYALVGLFESQVIHPFQITIGALVE